MLAVEKYTSRLFQRSHAKRPNNHFPSDSSTDALNVIAHRATVSDTQKMVKF